MGRSWVQRSGEPWEGRRVCGLKGWSCWQTARDGDGGEEGWENYFDLELDLTSMIVASLLLSSHYNYEVRGVPCLLKVSSSPPPTA